MNFDSQLPLELAQVRDQIRKIAEEFGLDFFETIFFNFFLGQNFQSLE